MYELELELGSLNLVQLLLDAGTTVAPEESLVPPLMLAVLHRHRGIVQSLLNARADPWQAVPVQSRSLSGRHVSTGFLDPVLGP